MRVVACQACPSQISRRIMSKFSISDSATATVRDGQQPSVHTPPGAGWCSMIVLLRNPALIAGMLLGSREAGLS